MDKAIAHFNKVGAEQAYKDFSDPKGGFIQGEIYVVVQDMQAKIIHTLHQCEADRQGHAGARMRTARNSTRTRSRSFRRRTTAGSSTSGPNPETKKIGQKESYIKKVNNDLYFIVGYYTD